MNDFDLCLEVVTIALQFDVEYLGNR